MNHDLNERIRQARRYAGLSTSELSDKVHMFASEVDHLDTGRSHLPEKIVAIASLCGVDGVWLNSGYGEMIHPSTRM
ncbi:MAG: helix-turn-helix domain-containing protein [Magnetococcales bacterium]|nr:helix-turn-helix domain-containing protein [Magnetococcales bacterium]